MSAATGALRLPEPIDELEGAITLRVVDRDGVEHVLPALKGWRVMEVIRDWGLDIKAECGGACACATCHVHVDEGWAAALPEPTEEEVERLDDAFDVTEASRLACQLLVTPALDGLRLRLAPGTER
jgi:ferredoxin, 2Fe-2S